MPLTRITRPLKPKERRCRWTMRKVSHDLVEDYSMLADSETRFAQELQQGPIDDEDSSIETAFVHHKRGQMKFNKRSTDPNEEDTNDNREEKNLLWETIPEV